MHLLRAALLSHVMWAPASSMAVLPQGMWTHSSSMAVLDGHASASHRLRTSRAQGCVMLLANRLYFDQVDESLLLDHLGTTPYGLRVMPPAYASVVNVILCSQADSQTSAYNGENQNGVHALQSLSNSQ
ncbi:hypothetical protein AB1Y20_012872 [Prymnesium parvum]|uniref:Uncharacterized protein n=1 Tax=Prymnesium parvum TaxID=97485 RepID=A0AB34IML0_PRYPA